MASGAGKFAVLDLGGAFNPCHVGHVMLMQRARDFFEGEGVEVLGGVLVPSTTSYVSRKTDGQAMSFDLRARLCSMTIAGAEGAGWIQVAHAECANSPRYLHWLLSGVHQSNEADDEGAAAAAALGRMVCRSGGRSLLDFSVEERDAVLQVHLCGGDKVESFPLYRMVSKLPGSMWLCVDRGATTDCVAKEMETYGAEPDNGCVCRCRTTAAGKVVELFADPGSTGSFFTLLRSAVADVSSTQVRDALVVLVGDPSPSGVEAFRTANGEVLDASVVSFLEDMVLRGDGGSIFDPSLSLSPSAPALTSECLLS
mmetsp:Transcript_19549/g.54994  ORF Transcript_19549/g.54994 Transcript_19549/m.54994 type:complete len:312 (-) Transcript_19549:300-1235(-)